jgi:plastocyanin
MVKYMSYCFIAIASLCLAVLLSLSSCQATKIQPMASSQPADFTVKIRNFKFEPDNLAIAVGKTVQFINVDEEPHTVTAMDGKFNSKALDTEQTWNYAATQAGTYPYFCSVHPFMKGTLTVTR